jgi:hypothetical protein
MKFLLLLYGDESTWVDASPDEIQRVMKEYEAFDRELVESGIYLAGEGLQPTGTATTVRLTSGETVLTDGPFAETREQLGGFYLLDCGDLDEAARWASKVPGLAEDGCVEVRPVMDYGPDYEDPASAGQAQA